MKENIPTAFTIDQKSQERAKLNQLLEDGKYLVFSELELIYEILFREREESIFSVIKNLNGEEIIQTSEIGDEEDTKYIHLLTDKGRKNLELELKKLP